MLEWLQNPVVAIGLAVAAMFFGYFFGLFEGRGQGYKRRQAEEAEEAEQNEPEAQAEPLLPVTPVLPPDESSLLDVSRDDAGDLRLKLEGERIEAAALSAEQRKRIIAILTQIRPWLESPTSAHQPAQPTPVQSTPLRPAPPPEARPVQSPRPAPPPNIDKDEVAAAPQSIVEQIDAILHAQLAGTPLMEKGIRLQESSEGGVIVWVGINKYQGLEDVPDDQIKAAIRTAISAWENRYTPGI
jgi:hypothetical protein